MFSMRQMVFGAALGLGPTASLARMLYMMTAGEPQLAASRATA